MSASANMTAPTTASMAKLTIHTQGPLGNMVLTPGPGSAREKVVWSRNSEGLPDRQFEIPCSGDKLANRDGVRDDIPPFTCGTYPRRAVIKHFLRKTYGGGTKYNQGAKDAVIQAVQRLINQTRQAWSLDKNFMCTCPNGSATGWECCSLQSNCATEPCPCPNGYEVAASVACCPEVCTGLACTGLMAPFSFIQGAALSHDLLADMGRYLRNDIWTSNDPWLLFDPSGAEAYKASWDQAQFDVLDAGLYDASKPVVFYDEATYPFKSTFWEHCTGLLQQVIWTMPIDRATGKPKGLGSAYDPINGQPAAPNVTYMEDYIQTLVLEAYKSSPVYWHYNVRHAPSASEVCKRTTPRPPAQNASFTVGQQAAARLGFSAMTLGGLGGADCYCGWWNSAADCKIPDALCASLVQFLGFSRICLNQRQVYNRSDHLTVLSAIEALLAQQPQTTYPCPALRVSDHWGFIDATTGMPYFNATDQILHEGVAGFRIGNADWLFASQSQIVSPNTRTIPSETSARSAALQCSVCNTTSIADHFIDELFPSAQGVRQSMPQSYCTRYGIELARLTVYTAAGLTDSIGQQRATADKWKMRCQFKLEELAVCNSFRVYNATGGPTDTSQCPFSLSVKTPTAYAVTPGCLLVIWNTGQQDGIYDPCVCVPCTSTPTIDVPAQLTTICRLEAFQTLVAPDVVPTESAVPLGSGSFRSLMDKPGFLQVNTPEPSHWALHTGIRDADLILDWWPDSWSHPVGYHVTPGCSLPRDAHWKTFDASWRWDSLLENMVLAKDESNDPFLARNAFGASGVCRANNYGMPMTGLNTMATCTMENANAQVDAAVPTPSTQPPWADGQENCAADSTTTPWSFDKVANPPRQWSVGTLQQDVLEAYTATEWGVSCGPYPLRTCITSSDCAPGLVCVMNSGTGVCGLVRPGKFECTSHAQCNNDHLCAGDGLCVDGVWQISNELPQDISFRTYSQNCPTGTPLDTWGTSIAETIPDILNASGLCSYRSWFENRRMASRNDCNLSDTCPAVSGFQPWNFSAPRRQTAGEGAFDSGVLKVQAHQCDRDYQYLSNFVSCTPNPNFFQMYDASGVPTYGQPATDTRTRTYRVGKNIPLIHYLDSTTGPTYGFTGIPKTYADLKLGTSSPAIIPCTGLKVCSTQPRFTVNLVPIDRRLVIDPNGQARGYTVQDLLACGVFGMSISGGVACQLDYAVAPLAYFLLNVQPGLLSTPTFAPIRSKLKPIYLPGETPMLLSILTQLPGLILSTYIGGPSTTLQDYVAKSTLFVSLYSSLQTAPKPTYTQAGTPAQLYYLTQFGAYEVPYAWWFKCAWLGGFQMGPDPVDESQCTWRRSGNASQPTDFGPMDPRLQQLFGQAARSQSPSLDVSIFSLLVELPGIITQRILDQAYTDYMSKRAALAQSTVTLLGKIQRLCYQRKEYVPAYNALSEDYQLQRLSQMYNGAAFDLTRAYLDANNATVCSGQTCLQSAGLATPLTSNSNFTDAVAKAIQGCAVSTATLPLGPLTAPDLDALALKTLFTTAPIAQATWDALATTFQNLTDGCNQTVTLLTPNLVPTCLCTAWNGCSAKIQSQILNRANIQMQPSPYQPPVLGLSGASTNFAYDVCKDLRASADGFCYLNNNSMGANLDFRKISKVAMPAGVAAELYIEDRWNCVELKCVGPYANLNGQKRPVGYQAFPITTRENLIIQEYEFDQQIPQFKANPWDSQSTQNAEQICEASSTRLQLVTTTTTLWDGSRIKSLSCKDTCSIPTRAVSNVNTVRLRAWNVTYLLNDTMQMQATFHPCIAGDVPQAIELPSFAESIPLSQAQRVWTPNSAAGGGIIFSPTYRPHPPSLAKCSPTSTGLPTSSDLKVLTIKDATYGKGLDPTTTASAMTRVLDAINSGIGASDCFAVGGSCSSPTEALSGSPWSDQKNKEQCPNIKGDAFWGCAMFPAEMTYPTVYQQYDLVKAGLCDTNNLHGNSFNYPGCMMDSPNDPCQSLFPLYRDMKLQGRTLSYQLTTTTPDCVIGPVSQCTLVDEISNLGGNLNAACPGTDRSQARFTDYMNLHAFNLLNTNLELPPRTLNGDVSTSATATGVAFDHMRVSLNPGYQCCPGCQPACSGLKLPVQMRKDLWTCLDCPMVSAVQCKGVHNCILTSPAISADLLNGFPGWSLLPALQKAYLTGTNPPGDTADVAVPAVRWLVTQVLTFGIPDVRLPYEIPDFMTSFTGPYSYNPIPVLTFNAAMQINSEDCKTMDSQMPDFTNCSYDGHRQTLRGFVERNYKTSDGVVVPAGNTLQWRVRRTQMITQNIPQWETANGTRGGMFIRDLLDDKWCMAGNVVDNACYVHTDSGQMTIEVLNPGLLGDFEPSEGCDTAVVNQQRVISAICSDCSSPSEYLALENGDTMTCPQTFKAAQQITTDATAPSNLCSKRPATDTSACANVRGMLGQTNFDGVPVDSVYTRRTWSGGLPAGVSFNPLFQGKPPGNVISNLALRSTDIGGHFIRMALSVTRGGAYTMAIQSLPLASYADAVSPEAYSLGVAGTDMRWTQVNTDAETRALQSLYPNSVCAAWDCPLRRRAFFMGTDANFRPRVPDPLRTQILYGSRAHPTQAAFPMPMTLDQTGTRVLGVYFTSNGFCACLAPPCSKCAPDIDALKGLWTNATVVAQSTCTEQLDWPYAGGQLRDGSSVPQRWNMSAPCGIIDRLPGFRYRYKNLQKLAPSSKTTLDKGGVCHMGWPVVTAGPLAGCYILSETDMFMCPTFLEPKNVTRLRAKTIPELLNSGTRPRLSDCNPPPAYAFGNGTATPPEVSYGQPRRWEAARLLANDLRRRLCGNSTVCKPASQWTLPSFWNSVYMANFPPIPDGNGENQSLWQQPWVTCTQPTNGTQQCSGTIPRSSWATGDRPQICLDAVTTSPLANSLTQNVDVCDLDASLDRFCRTVQDGRYKVFEANCLYSGQCRQKLFFYQPSTYMIDNGQFVRSTVQDFYNGTVQGACVPDQDTYQQIQANAQNLDKCAAMKLNILASCIQLVRTIVHNLVELTYYTCEIFLYVFQLLGARSDAEKTEITTQLNALLALIRNKFILLFQGIGDILYKLVFEGPMGSWLITIIQAICDFLEWLFSDVVYLVLCWARTISIWVLENVGRNLVGVLNGISFGQLGYLQDSITSAETTIKDNIPCSPQKLWTCNLPFNDKNATTTTLPLPTRCWAGVEPGVNSLACTAADTCIQSDYTNVICGACPAASSMTRFGCDSLTKLCTCDVFPVGVSSCSSHQECAIDDPAVSCRYVDSYLQPSYGNVPCTQCPNPVCLISPGASAGQCSCLLRPVPMQPCSDVGQIVSPDATQLCLVTSSGSGQSASSTAYTEDYRTLASAPCMLLNRAQAYCMHVYMSGAVSTPLVVGISLLSTRRRLLWETNSTLAPANWSGRGEPCRSLVLADIGGLGILERHTRAECWRWRDIGAQLLIEANMTSVSPYLLVSWRDLVDDMLRPGVLIEIMAKLPQVLAKMLMHSEMTQPLYIMVAYWMVDTPEQAWLNQTILNQARVMVRNATRLTPRRRLLSTDPPAAVINTAVAAETVYLWDQGPYTWPPNFVYWNGNKSCALASTALEVFKHGIEGTAAYYANPKADPVPVRWPSLPIRYAPLSLTIPDLSSANAAAESVKEVFANITDVWLDPDAARSYFIEAPYMNTLQRLMQCNFTQVQTCADRQALLPSILQTVAVVIGLGIIFRTVGVPYAEVLCLVSVLPSFLFLTYGYSPMCVGLVPTCLLSDVVGLVRTFLPATVTWPAELTLTPNCTSVACMRSCALDPIVGFAAWQDHVAWGMCEVDSEWAIRTAISRPSGDNLRMSILRKCAVDTDSMRTTQRICFGFTLANSLPILVLLAVMLQAIPMALTAITALVQFLANVAFSFLVFVHATD